MHLSPHASRVERWLGGEAEFLSQQAKGWYGPPIAVAGTDLHVCGDGDFVRLARPSRVQRAFTKWAQRQMRTSHAGFASLSDLISEMTVGGKRQTLHFSKVGGTGVAGSPMSLFNVGNWPTASGVGGTSGTGRACTRTTTGALGQADATGGDTLHLVGANVHANIAAMNLMLYDRLWDMTYNHATATSTAVDAANRPTRYQTTGLAPGNFIGGEVTTALSATAHNLTITYVDNAGNAAEAAAAYAAPVSAAAGRFPTVAPSWFVPLSAGDLGVQYITNVAQSTITSVTGITSWWIGHPLAFFACPLANMLYPYDFVGSPIGLERIYDEACLGLIDFQKSATNATTFTGQIVVCAG